MLRSSVAVKSDGLGVTGEIDECVLSPWSSTPALRKIESVGDDDATRSRFSRSVCLLEDGISSRLFVPRTELSWHGRDGRVAQLTRSSMWVEEVTVV